MKKKQLKKMLKKLTTAYVNMVDANIELTDQVDTAEADNAAMQQQIINQRDMIEDRDAHVQSLQHLVTQLPNTALEADNAILREQVANQERMIEGRDKVNDKLVRDLEVLKVDRIQLREEIQSLKSILGMVPNAKAV